MYVLAILYQIPRDECRFARFFTRMEQLNNSLLFLSFLIDSNYANENMVRTNVAFFSDQVMAVILLHCFSRQYEDQVLVDD